MAMEGAPAPYLEGYDGCRQRRLAPPRQNVEDHLVAGGADLKRFADREPAIGSSQCVGDLSNDDLPFRFCHSAERRLRWPSSTCSARTVVHRLVRLPTPYQPPSMAANPHPNMIVGVKQPQANGLVE